MKLLVAATSIVLVGCQAQGRYPEQCGAPLAGWKRPDDGYGVLAFINKVRVLREGTLKWNGKTITRDELRRYSAMLPDMTPVPFTIHDIQEGTSCATVVDVRRIIDEQAKCRATPEFSTCGEGAGPWALIGDVVGPNGETAKFYPEPALGGSPDQNASETNSDETKSD